VLKFPTYDDIVRLNHRHIHETGGYFSEPDNLRNPDSLKWVLEAIQYPLFGVDHYPTIAEKAAVLAWIIIEDHVFYDGCKRTGMSALKIFLGINGYRLNASNDEIVEAALRVAGDYTEENYTRENFTEWVRHRLTLRLSPNVLEHG
jgi:death-on-curing protein